MENYRNIGNTIYLGKEEFSRIFALLALVVPQLELSY